MTTDPTTRDRAATRRGGPAGQVPEPPIHRPTRAEPAADRPTRIQPTTHRPTRAELAAAVDRTIADVIRPGLRVLFCGINPGLWSAATGWHFARPGNRFWPALHRGGFTPRQLHPSEQDELLALGLGITNVATRATARADELSTAELLAGAEILTAKAEAYRPEWIAVVGVTAYRTGFGRPRATFGPQPERLGPARLWVLPNPSGLNAHYTPTALAATFAEFRAVVDG